MTPDEAKSLRDTFGFCKAKCATCEEARGLLASTLESPIEATLQERGARYGVFAQQAEVACRLKDVIRDHDGYLAPDQKEALDMIAVKIARILIGDPNFHDSWHDITGYSKLVADRLAALP